MELTPRLALAAEYCRGSRRVIDVGCDHAYLCIALVRQGVELAWASDLRPGPLAAAREHIRQMGETERIRTVLCPGLESFSPEDADTVVICGMGGELMASILQAAPWTGDGRHRLVLQPMTHGERLRRFLAENGYTVEREGLARESGRLYTLLQARGGEPPMGENNAYLFTDLLAQDPLFPAFLEKERRKWLRAAAGKRQAGIPAEEEDAILKRLEEWSYGA